MFLALLLTVSGWGWGSSTWEGATPAHPVIPVVATGISKDYGWQSPIAVRNDPNDFWWNHSWRANVTNLASPVSNGSLAAIVEDPNHGHQWELSDAYLNMSRSWAISTGSERVVVAVTDQEIDLRHYDFAGRQWVNEAEAHGRSGVDDDDNGLLDDIGGWSFDNGSDQTYQEFPDNSTENPVQHGTNMASILGAATNNEGWAALSALPDDVSRRAGIAGITWKCPVLPIDMISGGPWYQDYMVEYLCWLKDHGVPIRVVSMSWIGQSRYAAQRLHEADILGIAGAGNSNDTSVNTGAAWPGLLIVGAVDKDYKRTAHAEASVYGAGVDLVCYAGQGTNGYKDVGGFSGTDWDEPLWSQDWIDVAGSTYWTLGYTDRTTGQSLQQPLNFAGNYVSRVPNVRAYGIMPSPGLTSGATAQAAGVAALIFSAHPELSADQVRVAMLRGCANIDALNPTQCGGSCAGKLGAGRLDAYRALTLWGAVGDTTFSGTVYVSGDVWIKPGASVSCRPGTRFLVAPDDLYQSTVYVGPTDVDVDCAAPYAIDKAAFASTTFTADPPIIEILVEGSLDLRNASLSAWATDTTAPTWGGVYYLDGTGVVRGHDVRGSVDRIQAVQP